MAFIEMSRDAKHGGTGWEFARCLWSPTIRRGGGRWGYWELMRQVRAAAVIVHLQGRAPHAAFVGYSAADTDCYISTDRPPEPGDWDHAAEFFRIPLRDYVPFKQPIGLNTVFLEKREQLLRYHRSHSPVRSAHGRLLFYVEQGGQLQCQNGAYLSELDSELASILFSDLSYSMTLQRPLAEEVPTSEQTRELRYRIGQQDFSSAVRANFSQHCCFPGCEIQDAELIVGSHIARWADCPELRGQVSNGLCLCLFHDKLFELGAFTLSPELKVLVNKSRTLTIRWAMENVTQHDGLPIRPCGIPPSREALDSHRRRIGFVS